jgi:hypothetical protein
MRADYWEFRRFAHFFAHADARDEGRWQLAIGFNSSLKAGVL